VGIIKHFKQIAHICKECKYYNSLFAILSGLDHLSASRLKDTWDKVNLTQPIIRKLCACMALGVMDKADTIVLDHNEKLDAWAVVLNGHVECTLSNSNKVKSYHVGDQ
jgi:hypothetical protein